MRLGEEMEDKLYVFRDGNFVYDGASRILTINKQETKGPGNEVVKIEGLAHSNGQKWLSLSKIKEGDNWVECKKSNRTLSTASYQLTADEKAEIEKHQKVIDVIIQAAKDRYVKKPNLNVKLSEMTNTQKQKHIEELEMYLNSLRG